MRNMDKYQKSMLRVMATLVLVGGISVCSLKEILTPNPIAEAYSQKLNEDNHPDLIVKIPQIGFFGNYNQKYLFINQGDNTYKLLDQISKEEIEATIEQQKSIENKVKEKQH